MLQTKRNVVLSLWIFSSNKLMRVYSEQLETVKQLRLKLQNVLISKIKILACINDLEKTPFKCVSAIPTIVLFKIKKIIYYHSVLATCLYVTIHNSIFTTYKHSLSYQQPSSARKVQLHSLSALFYSVKFSNTGVSLILTITVRVCREDQMKNDRVINKF